MIVTKGDLVNGAYKEFMRISGLTTNASPDDVEIGLQVADDLANELKGGEGLDLNWQNPSEYGYSDPSDNSGLTIEMAGPFKKMLSINLTEAFGKTVTPNMNRIYEKALRALENISVTVPDVQNPPTLPFGSGNEYDYNDRRFYGEPAANKDAIYVFKGQTYNYSRDFTLNPNWLVDAELVTVEWKTQESGYVTIENITFDETTTSADLTFSETGGYTICITVTKTDSNEVFIVNQNFVVNLCDDQGTAFTL